jgi:hypothetical protein
MFSLAGRYDNPIPTRFLARHRLFKNSSSESEDSFSHGIINFIDAKAKCRHLKKFIRKGTLRQLFIRIYRLEIQLVSLVYLTQLCELLLL